MFKLINAKKEHEHLIKDDTVRPELDYTFRISNGREMYVSLDNDNNIGAAICVGYTHQVPKTVTELNNFSMPDFTDPNRIAVFYTVWSYKPGAGRHIVFDVVDHIKENKKHVIRFVTLSPKTEMARKFHLSNGAFVLSENLESDNYEYKR